MHQCAYQPNRIAHVNVRFLVFTYRKCSVRLSCIQRAHIRTQSTNRVRVIVAMVFSYMHTYVHTVSCKTSHTFLSLSHTYTHNKPRSAILNAAGKLVQKRLEEYGITGLETMTRGGRRRLLQSPDAYVSMYMCMYVCVFVCIWSLHVNFKVIDLCVDFRYVAPGSYCVTFMLR
jgi:hypothetical protein